MHNTLGIKKAFIPMKIKEWTTPKKNNYNCLITGYGGPTTDNSIEFEIRL